MFNIGGGEFLVIALIALIVLGPQRLPDAARQVGKVMGDLRRMSSGFQNELRGALNEPDTAPTPTSRANPVAPSTTGAVTAAVASVSEEPPVRRTPLQAAPTAGKAVEQKAPAAARRAPARPAATKKAAAKKGSAKKAAATKTATTKTARAAKRPVAAAAKKPAKTAAKLPSGGGRSVPKAARPRTKGS